MATNESITYVTSKITVCLTNKRKGRAVAVIAGLSPPRAGFAPGLISVGFVVGKVAHRHGNLRVYRFFPCQYHSTLALNTKQLFGGWTIGPLVNAVRTSTRKQQELSIPKFSVCGQSRTETGFSPSFSVFPWQYLSTEAPYSCIIWGTSNRPVRDVAPPQRHEQDTACRWN
jgi:hypothetical protein